MLDAAQDFPQIQLMSALFESVDDGIIVGDLEGRILFRNKAAVMINSEGSFASDPTERALHCHINSSDLPLRRALAEGEVRGLELELNLDSGIKKSLICNGRALYKSTGEKIGAILVLHDRTQERAKEIERKDLLRMNEELERFSAVAAHDLKSPLNSITQFVELLKESLDGRLSLEESQMLKFIDKAGIRLRSLIDDLLAFARSGGHFGQPTSVDLNSVVDAVLLSLHAEVRAANASLHYDNLSIVIADRVAMYQLFQNLISNALKYRSERPLVIRIESLELEDHWRMAVSDNGVGISIDDQRDAFELFKRFENSSKREGTGLGLPICKRVVESFGGSIVLESVKGSGTTISFTLPKQSLRL